MNWRSEASDPAKLKIMRQAWGDHTPDYLYYLLKDRTQVDEGMLNRIFFPDDQPSFGDKEIHESDLLSGHGLIRVEGASYRVLRIRNSSAEYVPAVIIMDGDRCPLVQFGHGDDSHRVGLDGMTYRAINFIKLWGWRA